MRDYKNLGILWLAVITYVSAYPQTQEELAQYVARQQVGLAAQSATVNPSRRQAYALQPQAKAVYQAQPKEQIYQIQPKQQALYQPQVAQQQQQYYQPQLVQQQQQYYQPQPTKKLVRPGAPGQQLEQDPEDYDPNPHYQFGFDIKDDEFTNYQGRKEQREGDKISGQYSVVDSDGYIRTVTYTADPLGGFKADVVREPTDIKIKFPTPAPLGQEQIGQGLAVRKQQTQQYLQASAPVQKPQYVLRPEHTQVYSANQAAQLRQVAGYTGAQQVQQKAYAQPSGANLYQAYQQ